MKTIGLIGGMSWESTVPYYQAINRAVARRLGGLHSARILLYSVDFHEVEELQHTGRWDEAGELLASTAQALQRAGADFLVLCTNTMHKVAPRIESAVTIPLLHIADATARRVQNAGVTRVGLLGTRFTMEEDFYRGRLEKDHGLDVLVPDKDQRDLVHRVIFDELCLGKLVDASRSAYRDIVAGLVSKGAEGVILGCTEVGLLLHQGDAQVPLFDTAAIHAEEAVDYALAE
jgi:aspartate racemase